MTRDEILHMEAGREMDALIAEKVMGIDISQYYMFDGTPWPKPDIIYYSTDIAAAWEVVEKITDPAQMTQEMFNKMANTKFGYWWDQSKLWSMTATEAAGAICRAALLANLEG